MSLILELNDIINFSHRNAWETFDWIRYKAGVYGMPKTATRWKSPGEPAFVSNLLQSPFTNYRLADVIEKHLKPFGLCSGTPLVSGVFIHQKPKVSFGKSKSQVELGDLLLVRQHFQSKVAHPQGRAFLMQAKAAGHPSTGSITKRTEMHQFALYANWNTPFEFPNDELGPPPTGKKWDFSIGPMTHLPSSGIYGVVANTRPNSLSSLFPDACTWAVGTPALPSAGTSPSVDASSLSLAAALEGFLLGKWGRPWESTLNKSDHWSTFVARSLERAASWRDYPIQRLGATALPRHRDVLAIANAFSVRPSSSEAASLLWLFRRDANLWPLVDFNRRHFSSGGFRTAAKLWKASIGIGSVGDSPSDGAGANNDLPPRDFVNEGAPSGGISVLYVVTFGDGALEETQPMPSRPQEPQPPNPEWGAY